MNPTDLIQSSSLMWLMATGLLLGALHALEPGHAKTMIASFVVATRGSVPQAILLGLSAALSHSLLIWILAGAALYFGNQYIGDDVEPWLQLGSGLVIVGIGSAMIWRLSRHGAVESALGPQGGRVVATPEGIVELAVFEDGVPPEFRMFSYDAKRRGGPLPDPQSVSLRTVRPDGTSQTFAFVNRGACLASTDPIPEPHEFEAILSLSHGDHTHEHVIAFHETHDHAAHDHAHGASDHHHHHHHDHDRAHGRQSVDAHAQAHARQIARRFDGSSVTTRQIALFGLSSGLMPCPAALTMLLVCLRLKKVMLGVGLVTAFSLGLAVTLVALGVVAAVGVMHASKRLERFDRWAGVLPYVSATLIVGIGIYIGVTGFSGLA